MQKDIVVDYESREVETERVVQRTDPETGEVERDVVETGVDYKTVPIRAKHLICDGCAMDLGHVEDPDTHACVSPPPTIRDDTDDEALGRTHEFIDGVLEDFEERAHDSETVEIDDVPIETYDDLRVAYLSALTQSEISEAIDYEARETAEIGDLGAYRMDVAQQHAAQGREIHDRYVEETTFLSLADVEEILYENRQALEATPRVEIEDSMELCRGCAAMIGIDVDDPTVPGAWVHRSESEGDEDSDVYHTSPTKLEGEEDGPAAAESGTAMFPPIPSLIFGTWRSIESVGERMVYWLALMTGAYKTWYMSAMVLFFVAFVTVQPWSFPLILLGALLFVIGFLLEGDIA